MAEPYVTSQQFEKFIELEDEHHKRVEEAGIERGRQIDRLGGKIDSIVKWRIGVDDRLTRHHEALFGNGKIGMDEMIRQILEYINEQKANEKEAWSDAKKFGIGALAFIINTLIAIAIARLSG